MNKNKNLLKIICEFTKEFSRNYVTSPSLAKIMLNCALNAKKESGGVFLSNLQAIYQDFLDKNGLEVWTDYSLRLRRVKGIAFRPFVAFSLYKVFLSSPESAANAAICLIRQTKSRIREETAKSALDYQGVLLLNEI